MSSQTIEKAGRPLPAATEAGGGVFTTAHHHFPQIWFLVVSLSSIGLYVAWDLNFLKIVIALDRSHITSIIAVLVLFSSAHAAWHIFRFSHRVSAAQEWLLETPRFATLAPEDPFLHAFIVDLPAPANVQTATGTYTESDAIVEKYADKLRSPVELGWFLVDLAVRLGLVGTIVGFILIFTSLSGSSIDGADGLKELLVSMSGGMGTALFTTLSGLIGATLLSVQYLILGRQVEHLVGLLVTVSNRQRKQPG